MAADLVPLQPLQHPDAPPDPGDVRGGGPHGQTPAAKMTLDAKSLIAGLPTAPGVYRMLDARGGLLYVGKARNLKNASPATSAAAA